MSSRIFKLVLSFFEEHRQIHGSDSAGRLIPSEKLRSRKVLELFRRTDALCLRDSVVRWN